MSLNAVDLLQRLCEAFGPSSYEDEVREIVLEVVTPLVDEVRVDRLGNVIATRRGARDNVLMLDAHMDEVGFLVSHIDDAGFLRLSPLGGWDARVLPAHAVTIGTRESAKVRGLFGTLPPHLTKDGDRSKAIPLEDLFVDIGATSRSEVEALGIGIGSPVVPGYAFERPGADLLMGKAFDDRGGCTIGLATLDALQGTDLDLTLVTAFTVSEELGLRGARTVANQVQPDVAIALECTTGVDVPGVHGARKLASFGQGPCITIADSSIVASRAVIDLQVEVAEKLDIPFQRKLPGGGGTDAGAYQTAMGGSLVGVISVPTRYIHAPLGFLRPSDLEGAIALATGFVREAGSLVA